MGASPEEKGKGKGKSRDILSGSDGDSDDGGDLSNIKVDEAYAKRLEHNKRREALQRLEELKKQGRAASSSSEESSSSSEDDAAVASRRIDRRMFQVIRRIRSNDADILDKNAKLYSSSSEDEADEQAEEGKEAEEKRKFKKERPLYLKDVNARDLLKEGPEFAAQATGGGGGDRHGRMAYNEQQREGLRAFMNAEKAALGEDDDEDGDLIKEKATGRGGKEGEEEEYEEAKQTEELLGVIFGSDEELDENEKFLKEYFLKRPYLEMAKENAFSLNDSMRVSEDEDELEKQEQYEANYSYRHEEVAASGAAVPDRVMGHSRVVEGSVRKKESSRKQQRKSKDERMAQEKQERDEELKHLKNLKKKEMNEKFEKVRMTAGMVQDSACKLGVDDLEEDFDPEEYDRKMQETFNNAYYEAEDVDSEFGSGEEIDLGVSKFYKEEANGKGEGEKIKYKISLKDKVELDKELEEYYKLDYEDTIGDIKTRFKYKQVKPNNFGLSIGEILAADDKNLNQYVSMKKLAPYMEEEWKVTHHKKKSKALILGGQKGDDKKVKISKNTRSEEGPSSSEQRKERLTNEQEETNGKIKSTRSNRRKRRRAELKLTSRRLLAYGRINLKHHKKC